MLELLYDGFNSLSDVHENIIHEGYNIVYTVIFKCILLRKMYEAELLRILCTRKPYLY